MKTKRILAALFACVTVLSVCLSTASAAEPTYSVSKQYKKSKYYDNLIKIPLSGDMATDVVAIALSQLGYHEGDSNADLDGMNQKGTRDFVEYNVLYGKLDNDQGNGLSYGYYWCASFVNWCLRQAGVSKDASAAAEVSCRRWLSKCEEAGIYKGKKDYIPATADLIFFKDAEAGVSSTHMGIVLYSDGKKVYTVEGNTSSGEYSSDGNYVTTKVYSLSSPYIVGYATPKYDVNEEVQSPDYSAKKLSPGLYISEEQIECYADMSLTEKVEDLEAFTVFRVEEIINEGFKIILEDDGNERVFWARIRAKARQLTVDGGAYSVSFLSQDEEVFERQYRFGETPIYLPDEKPTREDAGFVGWIRTEDPQEIPILPGAVLDAEENDVMFKAGWDTVKYCVRFVTPDGEIISEQWGYYGDSFEIPEVADAPEGYEFDSWSFREISGIIEHDATYTASFKRPEGYVETETETDNLEPVGCTASVAAPVTAAFLVALAFATEKIRRSIGQSPENK